MCRGRSSFKGEKVICQKAPLIHFWPLRPGHVGDDDDVFSDDDDDFGDADDCISDNHDDYEGEDDDDLSIRGVYVFIAPKASAEGACIFSKLLWSVYDGLLWSILMVNMECVKWVTMERLWWVTIIVLGI